MLDFDTAEFQRPCRTERTNANEAKLLILSNCNILRTGLAKALAGWPFQTVDAEKVDVVGKLNGSDWDVLLFDMPAGAVVDEEFERAAPLLRRVRCVVLTESFTFDVYATSRRYNAAGYLLKDAPLSALQVALLLVLDGQDVFPTQLALTQFSTMVLRSPEPSSRRREAEPKLRKLSQQEMKILAFLAQGDSNKVIARRLGTCEATVKVQMKAIFRKLGLQNRTQVAVWAVKNGFEAPLLNAESVPFSSSLGCGKLGRHSPTSGPPCRALKWQAHR